MVVLPLLEGVVVSAKKAPQGEMYAKWKRSSNRKVGREGDEEESQGTPGSGVLARGGGVGRGRRGGWGGGGAGSVEGDEAALPGVAQGLQRDKDGRLIRDELRTKDQIRKAKKKVGLWFGMRQVGIEKPLLILACVRETRWWDIPELLGYRPVRGAVGRGRGPSKEDSLAGSL